MPNVRSLEGKGKTALSTVTNSYLCHLLVITWMTQLCGADGDHHHSKREFALLQKVALVTA